MSAETQLELQAFLESSGKYSEICAIDEGANGYAYSAVNSSLNRRVFIKIVDLIPEVAASIYAEVRTIAQVTSAQGATKNIVTVYDCDPLSLSGVEYLCFQMEYVDGPSLGETTESETTGQQDAIRLTSEILHGVGHLHHGRILHRDLKPHNIMLSNGVPKISDFGSAVCLPDGHTHVKASRHSPVYIPPEGWLNPPRYSFSSDLYQVGIVLYELINGSLKYDERHYLTKKVIKAMGLAGEKREDLHPCDRCLRSNSGIAELASQQRLLAHGRTPKPYMSPRLARLVRKATNSDPDKRFATAVEFSTALHNLSLPNWLMTDSDSFSATDWMGFDWRIQLLTRARSTKVEVSRSRTGANLYRSINVTKFQDLSDAFKYIEGVKS